MTGTPDMLERWVQRHLTTMRAQPRQVRTVIGPAGTFRPLDDGEAIIDAPGGRVRIVERIGDRGTISGNQIEHGDHLHAVVRPDTVRLKLQMVPPTILRQPRS